MQRAYIFINSEAGKLWDVAKAASKVAGVKMADTVTGEFDIVVYVELDDLNKLGELINQLQSIDGVIKTQTSVVIPYFSSP